MPATETTQKDPVIVVLQLTGGNDYLNTVIPYNNPLYAITGRRSGFPTTKSCISTRSTASRTTWRR